MKSASSSTYGKKPHQKPETSTVSETLETQKASKMDRPLDQNVLKALNQVVQEPVFHIERKDLPLPNSTITIALTGAGK